MRNTLSPMDEGKRLVALYSLHILDTPAEERFDRITRLATRLFNVPIAAVSFIDASRQWFKSCQGMYVSEYPRDISICAQALLAENILVVPDARMHPLFKDNPLVKGEPRIRFYAGCPISSPDGSKIGTLCLMDRKPRDMKEADLRSLKDLATWIEHELNAIQLQQALIAQRENEARTRAVMNSVADGIITFDEQGIIESVNPAAERLFGYTMREVVGLPIKSLIPEVYQPGEMDQSQQIIDKGHAGDYLIVGPHREASGHRKDAMTFPLDLVVSEMKMASTGSIELLQSSAQDASKARRGTTTLDVRAIDEAIGSLKRARQIRFTAVIHDITERKLVEQRLRETMTQLEELYRQAEYARSETRAIIDAASEVIVLMSPDQRFLNVDVQFTNFFGLESRDVLGRHFDELGKEFEGIFADPGAFKKMVKEHAGDMVTQFKVIIRQVAPQTRDLELYSTPVHTADGTHLGRLYVFRDVTQEREVDRMKSEFISMVSHELRTPLTSIKGYIDLLMDGDAGELNEEQTEYLEVVQNNADRLVALINDLLDVSRIESGRIKLERTALDIAKLIRGVATSLRPQIEAKRQLLTLDIPADLPYALGDADRITQVLINFISNAYKYTPRGGKIEVAVGADPRDGFVRVAVYDTGIGMTPEEQSQLFTKFFRAKNSTTREVGGTGLGLTIARSLVQMHGGEITVESVPEAGSIFSFSIPMVREEVANEIGAGVTQEQMGGRILVVDDEPDIAHLIRRYLERAGYEVHTAHTAADALKFAQELHPDLITLDVMLPDSSGFTVLEWLKSNEVTMSIPVVMLSIVDDGGRARVLGAVGYLRKPISETTLIERVRLILAGDHGRLVLVADDDYNIRRFISGSLEQAGYQVVEAVDGGEAVEKARHERPALALIDIEMPGMDGVEVLQALRADPQTHELPVIMMSTSSEVLEEKRSLIQSFDGAMLLNKPRTMEELVGALAVSLAQARKVQK